MTETTIITHNGKFHPDDIFAVATILLFIEHSDFPAVRNNLISIVRTRNEALMKDAAFVVDVGGIYDEENNRFDHHQPGGAGARENGIPYASFGLVWKKYGKHLSGSSEIAEMIDEKLVQAVDAHDNGISLFTHTIENVEPYTLSNFVFSFLPTWKESPEAFDATFKDLVDIAQALIKREIKRAQAKQEARTLVETCYAQAQDKRIIILDQYLPWHDVLLQYQEPLFVIYPRHEDIDQKWNVSAVPLRSDQSFETRKSFPQAWAGKRDEELAKVSGVSDAIFCHNGLFLAVAKSKAGAIELAKKAINA